MGPAHLLDLPTASRHHCPSCGRRQHLLPPFKRKDVTSNHLWTAKRVAVLIRRPFDIRYHPDHVRRLLRRRLSWTSQKPQKRARERNLKEVERWIADDWPRIIRQAFQRQARPARSGQTAAVLFSFASTCHRLGVEPWAYLQDILSRLPTLPSERRVELLPDRWQAARAPAAPTGASPSAPPSAPNAPT